MKRRRFSDEFKAKVALEAIKGQRMANELAQEFGVHISQFNQWKKQLQEEASEVFSRGKDGTYQESCVFFVKKLHSVVRTFAIIHTVLPLVQRHLFAIVHFPGV